MKRIHSTMEWLNSQMPGGIPVPSSTIITGPAGAGKPLIGSMLIGAYLREGIPLIHMLINFNRDYSFNLLTHFNSDIREFDQKIVYVQFNPYMSGVEKTGENMLRANLLKPENWDTSLTWAKDLLGNFKTYPLVYGSALNMLLFSKTYRKEINHKILDVLSDVNENTMFTITNNVFEKQASDWENAADNVFLCHATGIMKLSFRIVKMKNDNYNKDEVGIPLTEEQLYSIRMEAEKARKHYIPQLRKI